MYKFNSNRPVRKKGFSPWLVVDLALRYWPVPLTLVSTPILVASAILVGSTISGLEWLLFPILLVSGAGALVGIIIIIGWSLAMVIGWADVGGGSRLRRRVQEKIDQSKRIED